jgi:hypothetical protein
MVSNTTNIFIEIYDSPRIVMQIVFWKIGNGVRLLVSLFASLI